MLRSLAVLGLVLAISQTANAACVIDRLRPTGTLPTMMMGQTFQFVATNDCASLRFTIARGPTKVPAMGATAGPGAHWYSVALSGIEWSSVTDRTVTVFRWTVVARDMTSGARIEVDGNNELDIDRDGWTRSEGDVGRCDDFADRNPDATEICDNGIDEDCDGEIDDCELDLDDADAVVEGTVEDGWLGSALEVADVNGDGIVDLLSGAPSSGPPGGHVYASFGPLSGTVVAGDDVTITPERSRDVIGQSLAGGDADGDGVADVLIGTWRHDPTPVTLLLGPMAGDVDTASADLVLSSTHLVHHFGYHLEITSDVDGDDQADLLVTAPAGNRWDGLVYVVPGTTTGSVDAERVATYKFVGSPETQLGMGAIALDDTDGDGIDDLAMTNGWIVYVVPGGLDPGTFVARRVAMATISTFTPFREWWHSDVDSDSLASLDADGDGYGDLLVGDADDMPGGLEGAVGLFLGPIAGALDIDSDPVATWRGDQVGTLIATGDCNGDGEADTLLGGDGDVYLSMGPATGVVEVDTLPSFPIAAFGGSPDGALLFAPDWSGDGVQEIVVGATLAGSSSAGGAYVYYSDRY